MRQVFISGHGGPEKLRVREAAEPRAAVHEVRIRVQAIGVNFADILARRGLYPDAPKPPCVVGYEVAGVVDATGPGARPDWFGKEVLALTRFGGYADTVVVPETQVFEKPAALTIEGAAAIPVNYLTAWQLMVAVGALSMDETALIHNAGGGVGLAAIDIGTYVGARLLGTASARKHEFLQEIGLHAAIDYRSGDWTHEVMRLTDGRGVELVLDPLGGSHWKKSYAVLRHSGRLGMYGISAATESRLPGRMKLFRLAAGLPWFNPLPLIRDNRGVFGVNLGHMWHEVEKLRGWMKLLLAGVDAGWLRPHVDCTFPLAAAGEAHAYIEARKNVGKVVLTV